MRKELRYREPLRDARRIVVKIGTRVLVRETGRPDTARMRALVRQLAELRRGGREVAVVTSGAIGAGMESLGMRTRPTRLPDLQMAAAVGQCKLMARYDRLFGAERCLVAQVLLTHENFLHKMRMTNARRTIDNLLRHNVIPIINENDVVADEEIRADIALGDNDLLSALLVKLVRADLLIILTTVNGVCRGAARGRMERISCIENISPETFNLVRGGVHNLSRGGMGSKLKAAQMAARTGASVVIADGRMPQVLARVMRCEDVGTLVLASV